MAYYSPETDSKKLWERAKRIIPGGNNLYSKRPEYHHSLWPTYYDYAEGCKIWTRDGRCLTDFGLMGLGTCPLGYSNKAVNNAVIEAIHEGTICSLNSTQELELAERLSEVDLPLGMVKFARTGGEAIAIAIRIAQQYTGRRFVLSQGYHGWHKQESASFEYGDLDTLRIQLKTIGNQVAAVVLEPEREYLADYIFLDLVRKECEKAGVVLISDEISCGFRKGLRPIAYQPDIVVYGKAMGNGFPIAAIIGREKVMKAAEDTFISSTYFTERVGFAAGIEVFKQFDSGVGDQILAVGTELVVGLRKALEGQDLVTLSENPNPVIIKMVFRADMALLLKTIWTQEMLGQGYLSSGLTYPSICHSSKLIEDYYSYAEFLVDYLRVTFEKDGREGLEALVNGPLVRESPVRS